MLEDLHYLREQGEKAAARGDLAQAANALFQAAQQPAVAEADYASVVRPLTGVLARLGRTREALTCAWYLAESERARARDVSDSEASFVRRGKKAAESGAAAWDRVLELAEGAPPIDRARSLAASGRTRDAAEIAESGGKVAYAAILRERAGDWSHARALWSRLSQVLAKESTDAYLAGLVSFNLARCAKKCDDARGSREALVASVRMLEEAADQFESMGQRERAFDCFQVLVQIGRETGAFEHVLEGFVNAVRLLREDGLKYFVLQHFDEALAAARDRGELSAAATLAREAASYARSLSMSAASRAYAQTEGELWEAVARAHQARGAPVSIAENAMLAAILAFGDVGQFARVGRLYAELGALDLEHARREHYTRASKRYAGVTDEPITKASQGGAQPRPAELQEVWHDDVIEWEEAGSAEEATADVILDGRFAELTRRHAMLARLHALTVPATGPARTAALAALANSLGQVQVYAMLAPLEALYRQPERAVRVAVLESLETLFFKRSFVTVRAALRETDGAIVDQASRAMRSLHFNHAFDPLARILAESSAPGVRAAAIEAIAHIDTTEAAELLLGLLDHGSPDDRASAARALSGTKASRFIELAKASYAASGAALQGELKRVFSARNITF